MTRPNVLLVTLDQFRGDHLSCGGHPVARTPTLDRLAAEGVRFANHWANTTPCGPSRASLLTGLYPMNHRVVTNGTPLDGRLPNLARLVRPLGYRPTLFGYTDTAADPRTVEDPADPRLRTFEGVMDGFEVGVQVPHEARAWLDWLAARGRHFDRVEDAWGRAADFPAPGTPWQPPNYSAEETESAFLTEVTLDWARSQEPGWFAHVTYLRPHPPFVVPEPYHSMVDPAGVTPAVGAATREEEARLHPFLAGALHAVPAPADEADVRRMRAVYAGMVAEVDHQLGRLLDGLDDLGMGDDTIVIVTSDHGEQLGDHGLVQKLGFFDQSFHIPLILRWRAAGWRTGRTVEAFTENVDIVPTILDLLAGSGLATAPFPPEWLDGATLRAFLEGDLTGTDAPAGWREAAYWEFDFREPAGRWFELFGLRPEECAMAVRRDRIGKYVHFAAGPPLYFDLEDDPGETRNRAEDPAYLGRVAEAARAMLTLRMTRAEPTLANRQLTSLGPAEVRAPLRGTPIP